MATKRMATVNKNFGRKLTRKELIDATKKIFDDLGPMTLKEFRNNKSIYRPCNNQKFYIELKRNNLNWNTLANKAGVTFKNILSNKKIHSSKINWPKVLEQYDSIKKSINQEKMIKVKKQ